MDKEKKDNKEEVEETTSEEETEETSAETEEETASDDDFDYKTEFEKLKTDTSKKDYAWEKLRKENKDLKRQLEGDVDNDEDKPDIRGIIKEEVGSLRQELLSDKTETEIEKLTDNEFAQKLIKLNLEKYPNMSVQEAWALANSGRLKTQMKEVKTATDAKARKGDGTGGAGQKDAKSTAPALSADNMAIINRMGLKWDGVQFSKKDGRFDLKPVDGKLEQIKLK